MARAETIVQLTDELRNLLDAEAAARGISRSALIRIAIQSYLAESSDAAIAAAIVAGYRRIPPGSPDEWGNLEEQQDRATRELMQRLDAEAAAAGRKPW